MKKSRRNRSKKVGLPPGALVSMGEVKLKHAQLSLFRYDETDIHEQNELDLSGFDLQAPQNGTLWLNIHGLHDTALMAEIGRAFTLHPLVLEDILNTDQRPKLDSYDDYLFFVTRFFHYDQAGMTISSEQVSLILGRNFVLTFQERPTGSFDPVRERLRADKGHIRKAGADYLAYALLDIIVDRYFVVLEQISDDCEALEEELLRKPGASMLQSIHKLKRETMELRRAVWPLREVVNALIRNEPGFFQPGTLIYLRDVYDHTVHFIESLESLRDLLAGMLDIYLSSISNRVNMELRALTVVAMLFMPATLIAGIFGMNFKVMPWLSDTNGFWFAMGLMGGIASLMGMIFWRRQWLSRR
ncbi:MAG TPA: magnesium/cobalt transporter CorA [Methylophilaceae bacterium]|nr:magnesium/cobalt transporter CorA [Methylophilaceae bacterium]HQR60388.1 magnesium/cobalt transporter CorA [Methylophilaceae bacterium]